MPDEREITEEPTNDGEVKPTITIAERQGSGTPVSDSKPTITIAEKDGDE